MKNIEVCWNITARCNQGCKYCHRFLNVVDLSLDSNKIILQKIINKGIKKLTWTGGEALLLPYLDELLKLASENNIQNKLITNGVLLTDERLKNIYKYLNCVNLSVDSIFENTNIQIGRDKNQMNLVEDRLKLLHNYNIKCNINTVLNKLNINEIEELAKTISNYNITEWRIFKFMALREMSLKTKEIFDISKEDFDSTIRDLKSNFCNLNITTRELKDFETLYLLILANGDVFITKNNQDIKCGNLLYDSFEDILQHFKELQ